MLDDFRKAAAATVEVEGARFPREAQMQPEENDIINIETAMADANRVMCARGMQSRVVGAAMAARAAYHAQVTENELAPIPAELAIVIAQTAFAAAWNSSAE